MNPGAKRFVMFCNKADFAVTVLGFEFPEPFKHFEPRPILVIPAETEFVQQVNLILRHAVDCALALVRTISTLALNPHPTSERLV